MTHLVACLLDLDNTLVLSDALEPMRTRRAWSLAYDQFGLTQLPPGTIPFLQEAASLARLSVVTTAPRPYAEKLLAFHGLDLDVAVAYHDTIRHKPDPAPLLLASERLGVPPGRCVHVGDRPADEQAAVLAGMSSVTVNWVGLTADHSLPWARVLDAVRALRGA